MGRGIFLGANMFIDTAFVKIRSGDGGTGCVSFHREKFKPKGGPDGGDGGDGGNVIFIGDSNQNTLEKFRNSPRLFAQNGQPGKGARKSGKKGKDLKLRVPLGTIIKDEESGDILYEVLKHGERIVIAEGGRGGRGNQHFATSTDQAPSRFEEGRPGVFYKASLELKVMADVGLLGFPNAGKSSLITAVSGAKPKIGHYPFTTLTPSLGVINLPDFRFITMADIPGIIEGAAEGKGLGIQFLRHVERTKILLFVIDISDYADPKPLDAFYKLMDEINKFGHGLADKKMLIAANKTDLDHSGEMLENFIDKIEDKYKPLIYPISAVARTGLESLIQKFDSMVFSEDETDDEEFC